MKMNNGIYFFLKLVSTTASHFWFIRNIQSNTKAKNNAWLNIYAYRYYWYDTDPHV